jgi:ubiquinone biosynthesis protein UbiJ
MGLRKMTFTVPDEIADQLTKRVPARKRSGYVAEAIASKLKERDRQLVRACEVANKDADVLAIETEMDALNDEITEPWIDAPSR